MVATVMGAVLLTTHSVVAILAVGDYARRAGEAAGVPPYRRANLLDLGGLHLAVPVALFPADHPDVGGHGRLARPRACPASRRSTSGMFNFYSWGVLGMIGIAVGLGYGRDE